MSARGRRGRSGGYVSDTHTHTLKETGGREMQREKRKREQPLQRHNVVAAGNAEKCFYSILIIRASMQFVRLKSHIKRAN